MTNKARVINIRMEQHPETGLLCATSESVPGLCVYHYDAAALRAAIPATIRNLFLLNEGVRVSVYEADEPQLADSLGSWVAIPPHVAAASSAI